mmetsp:Transcript_9163/g.10685  ORF Transcript_9163/g.10685 Transcript_9163/m.10685 type:complete len:132 (-) Transcript_9163:933-1328(-)
MSYFRGTFRRDIKVTASQKCCLKQRFTSSFGVSMAGDGTVGLLFPTSLVVSFCRVRVGCGVSAREVRRRRVMVGVRPHSSSICCCGGGVVRYNPHPYTTNQLWVTRHCPHTIVVVVVVVANSIVMMMIMMT